MAPQLSYPPSGRLIAGMTVAAIVAPRRRRRGHTRCAIILRSAVRRMYVYARMCESSMQPRADKKGNGRGTLAAGFSSNPDF
jgi:hypothetical protein